MRFASLHTDAAEAEAGDFGEGIHRVTRRSDRRPTGAGSKLQRTTPTYAEVRQIERFHERTGLSWTGMTKADLVRGFERFRREEQGANVRRYLQHIKTPVSAR